MKIVLKKKEKEKTKINFQFILAIMFFIAIVVLVYFIAITLNGVSAQKNVQNLDSQAFLYGQQLTRELSQSSALCSQNASTVNSSVLSTACGVTLYCYYSPSCEYNASQYKNDISIMCNAFKPNKVVATGICFKIPES
jgi:hypothetical protein